MTKWAVKALLSHSGLVPVTVFCTPIGQTPQGLRISMNDDDVGTPRSLGRLLYAAAFLPCLLSLRSFEVIQNDGFQDI